MAIAGIHVVVGVSECAMCKLKEKSHPKGGMGFFLPRQILLETSLHDGAVSNNQLK